MSVSLTYAGNDSLASVNRGENISIMKDQQVLGEKAIINKTVLHNNKQLERSVVLEASQLSWRWLLL